MADIALRLEKHSLDKHWEALTDPDGVLGLASLQDIAELSEEDIEFTMTSLGMNIMDKKRFARFVQSVKDELRGGPKAENAVGVAQRVTRSCDAAGEFSLTGERTEEAPTDRAFTKQPGPPPGPMSRSGAARPISAKQAQAQQLAQQAIRKAFAGKPDDADMYECASAVVYAKCRPEEESETVGALRKGQLFYARKGRKVAKDNSEWLQFTTEEFYKSCEPSDLHDCGFVLVGREDLGVLVRGPLVPPKWLADELKAAREREESQAEEEQRAIQERELDAEKERNIAKREVLKDLERRAEQKKTVEVVAKQDSLALMNMPAPAGAKETYVAVSSMIFLRRSEDPTRGNISQMSVERGKKLFGTGLQWRGPKGGLWVQTMSQKDGSLAWVAVEGPGFGVAGPMLMKEEEADDYLYLTLELLSSHNQPDVRIFDTFIHRQARIATLKAELCKETHLNPKECIILRRKRSELGGHLPSISEAPEKTAMIDDSGTPAAGARHLTMYVLYLGDFAEDYMSGELLSKNMLTGGA